MSELTRLDMGRTERGRFRKPERRASTQRHIRGGDLTSGIDPEETFIVSENHGQVTERSSRTD